MLSPLTDEVFWQDSERDGTDLNQKSGSNLRLKLLGVSLGGCRTLRVQTPVIEGSTLAMEGPKDP